MKLFLAGYNSMKTLKYELLNSKYMLESFYYVRDWEIPLIKQSEMFLLDSGAFTFMNNCKEKIDFEAYLQKYINFINKYDIKYFFELDIDKVVGYDKVKEYRAILEKKTGKKCIPVWHKSRGLQEYIKLTEEYNYIAIGGFAIKEIKKEQYIYIPKLLKIARQNNCKVHGLGFTSFAYLPKLKFYSVDSTTWQNGGKFGQLHIYKNGKIKKITNKEKKVRYIETSKNNLEQWIKMQTYADKYL